MAPLSYSFCMAMLHSLWQAGLLALFYIVINKALLQKHAPLVKRNLLFVLLSTQLCLFLITFFIYLFSNDTTIASSAISSIASGLLSSELIYQITPWIFTLYIVVVGFKMMKAIYNWYSFKRQFKLGLQKPDIELKLFTQQKAFQFGIKRKVKLWLSSTINTPLTFGFFKPMVVLPLALLNNISSAQAEALILHELTHIRTNDYLLNWFLIICETIFFFNPFVAMGCKRIRLEREQHCDISVIAFEYKPVLYAEALLQAERIKQMIPGFQLAAVSKRKQLLERIRFFSTEQELRSGSRYSILIPLIGLVFMFAVYSFMKLPTRQTQSEPTLSTIPNIFPDFNKPDIGRIIETQGIAETAQPELNKEAKKWEHIGRAVEKQVKHALATVPDADALTEEITENVTNNLAMPITVQENDASREIVIREEASGTTAASVKIYQLSFTNGKWTLTPLMMVTAIPNTDSSVKKRLLPPQ